MAVKTFYLTDNLATSPGWYGILQVGGTPPTAASTFARSVQAKLAVNSFAQGQIAGVNPSGSTSTTNTSTTSFIDGTSGPTAGTGNTAPSTVSHDGWRTDSTLNGTFASGNWVIAVGVRANLSTPTGRFRARVWRSVNTDGSSPTEITTSTQNGTVASISSTTVTVTSTITWAAPSFTVTNEYIFIQIEFQEQTSAGSTNSAGFNCRTGTETTVTTTDLSTADGSYLRRFARIYLRR